MKTIEINYIEIECCESTNQEVLKYLKPNQVTTLVSRQQTKGRGRLGRQWISTKGAYFTSFAFAPSTLKIVNLQNISWITLLSGIALRKSILDLAKNLNISFYEEMKFKLHLKWPNDLYFENKKLAGILCESKSSGNDLNTLIIGIGMNIEKNTNETPSIALAEVLKNYNSQLQFNAESFSKLFLSHLQSLITRLNENQFSDLIEQWNLSALPLHYPTFLTPDKSKEVYFLCLNNSGSALVLDGKHIFTLT